VFFAVMIGAMGLGQALEVIPDMAKGKGAASEIFRIIAEPVEIERNLEDGVVSEKLEGRIKLSGVTFRYPERPDVEVLKGLNLNILQGRVTALVGASGSGKSTIIQLLERYYDVAKGKIKIDGVNIKNYNLEWLRNQIGLVSQEPILFSCSIAENIRFGKQDATIEEIETAAKTANAHNFIIKFPDGYDTRVGEKGDQMSGGQKQRIAIARALLKDPRILLLDEATSALDTESESLVQQALERLMEGRTTITIAHRLATIRDADNIVVLNSGAISEQGTHEELIARNGDYAALVAKQMQITSFGTQSTQDDVVPEEQSDADDADNGDDKSQSSSDSDSEPFDTTEMTSL